MRKRKNDESSRVSEWERRKIDLPFRWSRIIVNCNKFTHPIRYTFETITKQLNGESELLRELLRPPRSPSQFITMNVMAWHTTSNKQTRAHKVAHTFSWGGYDPIAHPRQPEVAIPQTPCKRETNEFLIFNKDCERLRRFSASTFFPAPTFHFPYVFFI